MGQGNGATGAGHSPVCHLRDDVVPVLVVCAKRGLVSGALGLSPPTPSAQDPHTHPASCRRGKRPAGRSARTGTPPAAPPARAGLPACERMGRGDAHPKGGVQAGVTPPSPPSLPSPGVVDGGPAVHIGRPGVGAVDHQQLCLQDLPGLGGHVQRRGALLLWAGAASAPQPARGTGLRDPPKPSTVPRDPEPRWRSPGGRSWPERPARAGAGRSPGCPSARSSAIAAEERTGKGGGSVPTTMCV